MTVTYTNLYTHDAEFNADYYVKSHMPLVSGLLGPSTLVSWTLYKLPDDAPFAVEAAVTWTSIEARQAALTTENGKRCAEDLANFSKKPPIVMLREEVASGHS